MLKRRCTFCSSAYIIITKAAYNRPLILLWYVAKIRWNCLAVAFKALNTQNIVLFSDIDLIALSRNRLSGPQSGLEILFVYIEGFLNNSQCSQYVLHIINHY